MEIYTDGACSGNPGPGGWSFIILENGREILNGGGGQKYTTNNQMELRAAIEALYMYNLHFTEKVVLYSDSEYVVKGAGQWLAGWKKKGWKTAQGKDVKNLEEWKMIDELNHLLKVEWKWVKAHNGHPLNDRVDRMAVEHIPKK